MDGLLRWLISLSLVAMATFILDWTVPDLPRGVRLFFSGGTLVLTGYIFYRYIFYPLRARIKDDDIALCLERIYPDLNDRLISSVQLSRPAPPGTGQDFNSPELIQVLLNETIGQTQPLDFRKALNYQRQKKMGIFTLVIILLMVTYAFFYPAYADIWFNRVMGCNQTWPKKTFLQVTVSKNPVAKGENVTVKVMTLKGAISKAQLYYEFDSGEPRLYRGESRSNRGERNYIRMKKIEERNEFEFDFLRVTDSFRFRIKGGDDLTDWHRVEALTPPRIEKISLSYNYPDYTKLPDSTNAVEGSSINAPIGTVVEFTAFSNIELKSARLILGNKSVPDNVAGTSQSGTNLKINYDSGKKQCALTGEIPVIGDGFYLFYLVAENGLSNIEPIKYLIKAIIDTAPEIKINEPVYEHKYVTPLATVPFTAVTADDYGINEISFNYQFIAPDTQPVQKINFSPVQNNAAYGSLKIESRENLELAQWGAKEGNVIKYFLEAVDNCAFPDTIGASGRMHRAASHVYRFTVISPEQMKKKIEEIELRLKEEIKKNKEFQSDSIGKTEDFINLFADKDKLEPAEQRSLENAASGQRRISQGTERIHREFNEIIKDIVINKLWDQTTVDKLNGLSQILKDISLVKSPVAAQLFAQAVYNSNPEQRRQKLGESREKQKEILQDLENILLQMEEWEDYQEVVRVVRELIQKQERVIKGLKE